jgi:DNA-binding winged helix-turn-helix (wHTH) protein
MGCELLAYLLTHRDRLVPKEELLAQVRPGQYVGDAVLHACILAVRRAPHHTGRTPALLHTVRGRGYRFVAPVEVRDLLALDDAPPALPPQRDAALPQAFPPLAPPADSGAPTTPAVMLVPHPIGEYKPVSLLGRMLAYLREAEVLAAALDDSRRLGHVSSFLSSHFCDMSPYDRAIATAASTRSMPR